MQAHLNLIGWKERRDRRQVSGRRTIFFKKNVAAKRYLKSLVLQPYLSVVAKYEYWSKDQHEAWQLARLKKLLAQAERHVPFYRTRFKEVGFSSGDFRDIGDFQKLPFITKSDIQTNGPGAFCDERVPSFMRAQGNTGGSSGIPCPLLSCYPFTRFWAQAFMIQQWRRLGYKFGDRIAALRGRDLQQKDGIYEFDPVENRLTLSTYRLNQDNLAQYIELINDLRIRFLHVYPASLALFLDYLRASYGRLRLPHLKGVLAGSEMLLPNQKLLCEKVLEVPCYHWYGHSEGVLLGGWCENTDNFHFFPQYGYLEMICDDGTSITDHDDVGELVGTGFRNPAMTLIRYRTGDIGTGMRWQQCRCGREFPTLNQIHGRTTDYLVTRDGCKVPFTAVLYGLHLPIFEHYAKFQVEQSEPGRIKVRLENRNRISHPSDIVASKNAIERALEGRMLVFVEEVEAIPANKNGKHQVIIQHLPIS